MKTLLFTFILLSLVPCTNCVAAANDRQIAYVQQETPNALVIVVLIQKAKIFEVYIRDSRAGKGEKRLPLSKNEFEEFWTAFSSKDVSKYLFEPKDGDNMSEIGFYTIELFSKKSNKCMRIPRQQIPECISPAITKIKAYIEK